MLVHLKKPPVVQDESPQSVEEDKLLSDRFRDNAAESRSGPQGLSGKVRCWSFYRH